MANEYEIHFLLPLRMLSEELMAPDNQTCRLF
jgi:hypothetical protein